MSSFTKAVHPTAVVNPLESWSNGPIIAQDGPMFRRRYIRKIIRL